MRTAVASCCGWLLLHAAAGHGASLSLDLGGETSDNIERTATDEDSQTTGIARLAFGVTDSRPRLETNAAADLEYRHYFDALFDDEVVGALSGEASLAIIKERFNWVVQDNYGQVATNRVAPDTPNNRSDFNYFSTGPDLTIPLGALTTLSLSGRWSDVYYEDQLGESERKDASAGLARKLSETSTLSINASAADIEYDEAALFPEYKIKSGYLRYEASGSHTSFSSDAGYTEIEREGLSSDGPLFRLSITRQVTSRTSVALTAGSEFMDSATSLRTDQAAAGVSAKTEDGIIAGDVFRDNYVYLSFSTARERTGFNVGVFGRRERHEDQILLDRDIAGANAGFSRRLTTRMDFELHGEYSRDKFVESGFSFDEWSAGVGFGWHFTQAVSLRLTGDHFEGSGDGTIRDYEENRAFLGIRYDILQERR